MKKIGLARWTKQKLNAFTILSTNNNNIHIHVCEKVQRREIKQSCQVGIKHSNVYIKFWASSNPRGWKIREGRNECQYQTSKSLTSFVRNYFY